MKVIPLPNLKLSLLILLSSLIIYNCSKDNNPVQSDSNFSGLWTGTITSSLVVTPAAITITINQTNNNISGNYSVVTGASGIVAGTVNNNSVNFTLTQTTSSCTGNFSGQGTLSGNTLTFNYTGNDCWGSHQNGHGNLTKYEPGADVICPLYVGISWTYVDSTYSTSGAFVSRDSSKLGITGKNTFNYQSQNIELFYWNWINLQTNKAQNYMWLVRNDNDGFSWYGGYFRNQPSALSKSLNIKFPANVGDTWNYPRWTFNLKDSVFRIADTVHLTCIANNQIYKTPAGNLNCFVYTYMINNQTTVDSTYLFYSKNKGYVGMIGKTNGIMRFKKVLKR